MKIYIPVSNVTTLSGAYARVMAVLGDAVRHDDGCTKGLRKDA